MPAKVNGNGANPALKPEGKTTKIGKQSFLEEFTVLPEGRFRTTPSGLMVATVKEGSGTAAANGMKLKVKYTGWLESGKKFDSSLKRNQPFELNLGAGQVIKGWEEGLAGMKPGERRQLVIPANLAYGNRKVGNIPPGSTLIFNIELVSVEPGSSNPKGKLSIVA